MQNISLVISMGRIIFIQAMKCLHKFQSINIEEGFTCDVTRKHKIDISCNVSVKTKSISSQTYSTSSNTNDKVNTENNLRVYISYGSLILGLNYVLFYVFGVCT